MTLLEDIRERHLNGTTGGWSDDRVELLKKYHGDGLSMTLIADQINYATGANFSRNAIIGKCLRLGLPQRRSSISIGGFHKKAGVGRPNRDRSLTQRVKRKDDVLTFVEVEMPSPDHLAIGFFDLAKHHCRFIKDNTFCGQNVEGESSWCPFHRRLVYLPPQPRRRAA